MAKVTAIGCDGPGCEAISLPPNTDEALPIGWYEMSLRVIPGERDGARVQRPRYLFHSSDCVAKWTEREIAIHDRANVVSKIANGDNNA